MISLLGFGFTGGWEWIVILVIAVLIFGRRLPDIARSVGRSLTEFKKGVKESENEFKNMVDESDRIADKHVENPKNQSDSEEKPS